MPHWAVAVNGEVAEFFDHSDLGEDRWSDGIAEGGLVDVGAEVILIGELETGVVLVKPVDRQLEGAAGVEAGGAGVRVDQLLRLGGGRVDVGPFGLEEIELRAHSEASCASIKLSRARISSKAGESLKNILCMAS